MLYLLAGIAIGLIIGFSVVMLIFCFHDDSAYEDYQNDQTKK